MVDTLCSGYRLRDNRADQEREYVPANDRLKVDRLMRTDWLWIGLECKHNVLHEVHGKELWIYSEGLGASIA
jgi:hypothetical protein